MDTAPRNDMTAGKVHESGKSISGVGAMPYSPPAAMTAGRGEVKKMAKGNSGRGGAGHRGGSSPNRSPNDDRSDAKNPTTAAYAADQANRASQAEDDE